MAPGVVVALRALLRGLTSMDSMVWTLGYGCVDVRELAAWLLSNMNCSHRNLSAHDANVVGNSLADRLANEGAGLVLGSGRGQAPTAGSQLMMLGLAMISSLSSYCCHQSTLGRQRPRRWARKSNMPVIAFRASANSCALPAKSHCRRHHLS